MRLIRILILTITVLLSVGARAQDPPPDSLSKYNIRAFSLLKPVKKDLLFVSAKINGISAIFLMDTGATLSVLDINQLGDYYLTSDVSQGDFSGIGGSNELYSLSSTTYISINDEKFRVDMSTSDISSVVSSLRSSIGLKILGILGSDFFSDNKVIIDYNRNAFYIFNSSK